MLCRRFCIYWPFLYLSFTPVNYGKNVLKEILATSSDEDSSDEEEEEEENSEQERGVEERKERYR